MTEGFRGIYPVGEQARPYGAAIFDVMYDKPALLVPPEPHRRGAPSASISAATCCAPLDEAALRADRARACGARTSNRSRCACCSRSCIRSTRRGCARSSPRRCRVAASRCPRRSCRRSASTTGSRTTVINAYLQPILARYIDQLDRRLDEAGIATRQKYIMQSNGGMATFAGAAQQGGHHGALGPGRRRHRRRLRLPHDRHSRTSSPSTWAARPATSR